MKKLLRIATVVSLVCFSCLPWVGYAHIPIDVEGKQVPSLAPMLSQVTPSVVNVAVEKAEGSKIIGVGSGVIINAEKGYIVTNAHVVKNQKIMIVTLKDGRHYRAKLIGKDDGFDIAVIQINANHLKAISYGNSNQLQVGDFVVAIGSPFNLAQTVTSGVVSALNRDQPHIEGFQNFIQTDAPINPGNSGGALINMEGQLIGINTAIVTPSTGNIGIGFAIPSNLVKNAADQLIQYGKVARGILGVYAQNISPELADALNLKNTQGAIVTQIIPNSPSATAGVQVKDIIESINGNPIDSSEQLHNTLGLMRPGTKITITLLRDHKPLQLNTVVSDPASVLQQHELPFLGGMQMQKFNDLETDGSLLQGVLVTHVEDTSAGAIAGVIPGDVIVNANGQSVSTVEQLIAIAKQAHETVLFTVARGNGKLFLVVQRDQ